jgi:hypothetical protein
MRYRLRTLLIALALMSSAGIVLLLLECGLVMLTEDFLPLGIGGWLLQVAVYHYGIPTTLIFVLVTLTAAAAIGVVELASTDGRST